MHSIELSEKTYSRLEKWALEWNMTVGEAADWIIKSTDKTAMPHEIDQSTRIQARLQALAELNKMIDELPNPHSPGFRVPDDRDSFYQEYEEVQS